SDCSRDRAPCGEYRVTRTTRSLPLPEMNISPNSSLSYCVIRPAGITFHSRTPARNDRLGTRWSPVRLSSLSLQHVFRKRFQRFLRVCQELIGNCTVDEPMVERNREVRTHANRDGVFPVGAGKDFGAFLDR